MDGMFCYFQHFSLRLTKQEVSHNQASSEKMTDFYDPMIKWTWNDIEISIETYIWKQTLHSRVSKSKLFQHTLIFLGNLSVSKYLSLFQLLVLILYLKKA